MTEQENGVWGGMHYYIGPCDLEGRPYLDIYIIVIAR